MDDDLVTVDIEVMGETELAYLVTDSDVEAWIPKSQIEDDECFDVGESGSITIPEWLAEEKGLI